MLGKEQMLSWTIMENYNINSAFTKKDGGNPYLRILSEKIRTAQKCIQELKTCIRQIQPVRRELWQQQ